jgi:hypothetical protein
MNQPQKDDVIKKLMDALAFYAEEKNWRSPSEGFALQYDPRPSPVIERGKWKFAKAVLDQVKQGDILEE